jgi:signal transduction histidine kinase
MATMEEESRILLRKDPWFEALADVSDVGVLMFDHDARLQFVSGLANQLLRCESGNDLERAVTPLVELVASASRDCDGSCEDGVLSARTLEFTVESSEGTHAVGAVAHSIQTENCVGVLVLLRDRDREDLVHRDLRMASQFRNVGQLYQALAHDLRSPVGSIIMAASLVRAIGDSSLPAGSEETKQFEQWLEAIEEAATTLEQSLNLILGELTATDDHSEHCDLPEIIGSVIKLVAPQARKAGIGFESSNLHGPSRVLGSPARLKLALLNIATNAMQAMGASGTLRISFTVEGRMARISVQDTGPGIQPQHLNSIFDRYYTTKGSGTGIGLHISREIVENYGGSIAVQSQPGEGATFTVVLPTLDEN